MLYRTTLIVRDLPSDVVHQVLTLDMRERGAHGDQFKDVLAGVRWMRFADGEFVVSVAADCIRDATLKSYVHLHHLLQVAGVDGAMYPVVQGVETVR